MADDSTARVELRDQEYCSVGIARRVSRHSRSTAVFSCFCVQAGTPVRLQAGGTTVTSLAVLQDGRDAKTALYKFAVNQQKIEQLEETQRYVEGLLKKVDQLISASCGRLPLRAKIHRDIMLFNKPRILVYLRQLQAQLVDCRTLCDNNRSDDVAEEAQAVIEELEQFQKSTAGELIADRAREGRALPGYRSSECERELQHTISRLVAYTVSVRFLIQARKMWPRLFKSFKVSFMPSSNPSPRVFRKKSGTAEGIIGRMSSKPQTLKTFKQFVQTLQGFDLDARIMGQYENPKFRPIVHSELLLLNWLQNSGAYAPRGSLMGICSLAQASRLEHPSAVNVRATHGNLYLNWRFPDVLVANGPEAIAARDAMVEGVLDRIRDDAFDMVKRKLPSSYKHHDSNTFSARLTAVDTTTVDESVAGDVDDVTSLMGDMGLGN
ncbi:uncharacterized protein PG998_014054 [Apiospora kogelbergensis]|uniref:uncharacterized protein n=1 Tax=Apiospora kogelbergensis TaxID=1337665 RepID=UPI00312FD9AD